MDDNPRGTNDKEDEKQDSRDDERHVHEGFMREAIKMVCRESGLFYQREDTTVSQHM
jgi:hypothetical protein